MKKIFALIFGLLLLTVPMVSGEIIGENVSGIPQSHANIGTYNQFPKNIHPHSYPTNSSVAPQCVPIIIIFVGMIIADWLIHYVLEHYVSPEAALAYDIITMVIPGKAEIKVLEMSGSKIVKYALYINGRKVSEVSETTARWVKNTLGREYIEKIAEKYVKRGEDFDNVVKTAEWLSNNGVRPNVLKYLIDKGYDLKAIKRDISKLHYDRLRINGYDVVIERGNDRFGLEHVILRHKYGYDMENKYETSFFPMGQRVVADNGRSFWISNRMDVDDLRSIIEKAVEIKRYMFDGSREVKITYELHGRYGIDEVLIIFRKSDRDGKYHLITAYPISGSAVIKYLKDSGRFVYTK